MSVSSHLAIDLHEYDARIRTFIPDYEEMLDVAAQAAAIVRPLRIVDLGTGTGALAARVARLSSVASITAIDEDSGMLAMAARRFRRRPVTFVHDSFLRAALPKCDAITASLALHHVASPRQKRALFARVRHALGRRGVLVTADCHPPSNERLANAGRAAWLAHLAVSYGPKQAKTFLQTWAQEDFYTTLDAEQRLMRAAGFATDVIWRRGAFAVIVAQPTVVSARRTRTGPTRRPGGPRASR